MPRMTTCHVLDTLIYAEMPLYQFGAHRYWREADRDVPPITVTADATPVDARHFDITYHWRTTAKLPFDASVFVHFTNSRGTREGIIFQQDHAPKVPTSAWPVNQTIDDGPYRVEVPAGERGEFGVDLGLLNGGERLPLAVRADGGGRYRMGVIVATERGLSFRKQDLPAASRPFARREGWAAGRGATDRFIKNTYELLSWTHRLAFNQPFEEHSVQGGVERTRFGRDLRIAVNYGPADATIDCGGALGTVTLPANGLVVWSPTFVAVHAMAAAGRTYATPVLFTARSLDGRPLAESAKVRLYHGCGGPELALGGKTFSVEREAVVALR